MSSSGQLKVIMAATTTINTLGYSVTLMQGTGGTEDVCVWARGVLGIAGTVMAM